MPKTAKTMSLAHSFGCTVLITVFFILVGLPLLILGLAQKRHEKNAKTWATARGTLLKDEMVPVQGGHARKILYTYTASDGILRTNSQIGLGFDGNCNFDFPRQKVVPISITVWYNPNYPAASALVLRSSGTGFLIPLGAMFASLGVFALGSVVSSHRKKRLWIRGVGWVKTD